MDAIAKLRVKQDINIIISSLTDMKKDLHYGFIPSCLEPARYSMVQIVKRIVLYGDIYEAVSDNMKEIEKEMDDAFIFGSTKPIEEKIDILIEKLVKINTKETKTFIVKDIEGNDVTETRKWLISSNGKLYYLTDDIDMPLVDADNDYVYEIN